MSASYLQPDIGDGRFSFGPVALEWLVRNDGGDWAGLLPNGHILLVVASVPREHYFAVCECRDFADLARRGADTIGCPNSVLREVAHKLGIAEWEGRPVDEWFRDEDG